MLWWYKKQKVSWNSVHLFSSYTCHKNFAPHTDKQTDTQTDIHFPKIVNSCSGHPKTCKSIKSRKSKICSKSILSCTYVEESKNWSRVDMEILRYCFFFQFYITGLLLSFCKFSCVAISIENKSLHFQTFSWYFYWKLLSLTFVFSFLFVFLLVLYSIC